MASGSLLLLAGPNGAGKSTLFRMLRGEAGLQSYVILNADDRTLAKLAAVGYQGFAETPLEELKRLFVEAANEVYYEATALLDQGANVCLETVLSTDKYCEMVGKVIAGGGRFELFYVALRSPAVSAQRVAYRVLKGGHDVPRERLEERWKRSLQFLPWFAQRADEVMVFDNSGVTSLLIAKGSAGSAIWRVSPDDVFPELRLALEQAFPTLK
jgi:predicted ABC-type ATPase